MQSGASISIAQNPRMTTPAWPIVTKPPLNAIQGSGRGARTMEQGEKACQPAAQFGLQRHAAVNSESLRKTRFLSLSELDQAGNP